MADTQMELLRALTDARDLAMKNVIAARIPESGDFGAIAQNLDWVLDQLKDALASRPAEVDTADCSDQKLIGYVVDMLTHVNPTRPDATRVVITCILRDGWRELSGSGSPWSVSPLDPGKSTSGEVRAT